MKALLLFLAIFLFIVIHCQAQNSIFAGQTTGNNIHYTDYEPDSAAYGNPLDYWFYLDVDNNGINDLRFGIAAENNNGIWGWISSDVTRINDNIFIVSYSDNYVAELQYGDTISENSNLTFSNEYSLTFQYYWFQYTGSYYIYGYYGIFNDGYLGFKMEYPAETFFGWINISATTESIIAKESAICGLTVGINKTENKNKQIQIFPNPCRDELNLKFNSVHNNDFNFEIINLLGKIVLSGNIQNNSLKINTSQLDSGYYILRMTNGNGELSTVSFIKKPQ
jgi:hypothetical protein